MTALKGSTRATPTPSFVASEERLRERVPWVTMRRRALDVARHQAASAVRRVGDRLPAPVRVVDRPRTQPLRSASLAMYRFWKSPFGTAEKPHSLNEVPWDYAEANRDKIPFLGLREYWYPALESKELRNNETKAVLLAGDQLVFFRDATGAARALENRCPHRGPLLSLGQVGVIEPGTITCRYHGMTFDGGGACVAFLTDGPDSPACGKVTALAGGRTSVYRPGAGRARLARGACAAESDGISAGWGTVCAPDNATDVTINAGGPVRSLTDDPARDRVVAVTMGGAVISITDDLQTRTLLLPLNSLGDRSRLSIGPRKEALDAARDALWVPIQQLETATCAAWPCPPEHLDQWLVRIDLTRL